MADSVELATAWIRVVPSLDGVQGKIANELGSQGRVAGQKFGSGFKSSAAKFLTGAGLLLVAKGVSDFVGASIDSLGRIESINAQTDAAIRATGGAANVTRSEIENLTGSLESMTAVEAESIQEGANLLLTFKNVQNSAGEGNDIFNQSVVALNDMAKAMGQEPQAAAVQLGKALNDPIAGISALSRVGVQFTGDQKSMIKSLVETGQTMEAQKIILGELNSQFGGSGAAYAETYQGQMDLLGHSFGTLGETILSGLMPHLVTLAGWSTDFFNMLAENQWILVTLGTIVGVTLVGAFVAWTVSVWGLTAALLANPITWVVMGVMALIAALTALITNWDGIVAWAESVWRSFTEWWQSSTQMVVDWFISLWGGLGEWWNNLWTGLGDGMKVIWDGITAWASNTWNSFVDMFEYVFGGLSKWWSDLWNGIGSIFDTIWKGIGDTFKFIVNGILKGVESFLNGFINMLNLVIDGINAVSGSVGDVFGQNWRIPRLGLVSFPMLAEGGTITGAGSVIVGERGPELLHLPKGASVDPDIKGGNGTVINIMVPEGRTSRQEAELYAELV